MIRVCTNITLLHWGLSLPDRVGEAVRRGFEGVECLFPYEISQDDWDDLLTGAECPLVLINTPEPDWDNGARGCAAIPGATARFMTGFFEARKFAYATGCKRIHVLAGCTKAPEAFDTFVENLRTAAAWTPECILTIEPLNPHDVPGYFLNDFDLAIRVLDAVDMPNVGLQYDSWHASIITGDPRAVWARHHKRVAHVQIAGLRSRGAPDISNPVEAELLNDIVKSGYDNWISAQFLPSPDDPVGWKHDLWHVLGKGPRRRE